MSTPRAAAAATTITESDDTFIARPSRRVGGGNNNVASIDRADGSTWQEFLAVAELQAKLQIRSYYENRTTGKRVWDEPPTGASHIIPATKEMHKMATIQLDELYIATEVDDIEDNDGGGKETEDNAAKETKKKNGFMKGLFGGRKKNNDGDKKMTSKIRYKPDSKLMTTTTESSSNVRSSSGKKSTTDRELQAAIERSIADSQGKPYNELEEEEEDDEELAMAKALSLSASNDQIEDEDEMLRKVLELSKLEADNDRKPPATRPSGGEGR
jgi:hypothetical protein